MGNVVIKGTSGVDFITLNKIQNDQLTYTTRTMTKNGDQVGVENKKVHTVAIKPGDTIEADLNQGAGNGEKDVFSIDQGVDLRNYQMMIDGQKSAVVFHAAKSVQLGDVNLKTGAGDDAVVFEEYSSVQQFKADLGDGKNAFRTLNRFADPSSGSAGDGRMFSETLDRVSKESKMDPEEIKRQAAPTGFFNITSGAGEDAFEVGSYTSSLRGDVELNAGPGYDRYWLGTRQGPKDFVTVHNERTNDFISVDQATDAAIQDRDSIHKFDTLLQKEQLSDLNQHEFATLLHQTDLQGLPQKHIDEALAKNKPSTIPFVGTVVRSRATHAAK